MPSDQDKKISIVIPTYNREEVLCQTIDLALRLDYRWYEVIVVDQTKRHLRSTEGRLEQIKDKIRYSKLDTPNTPTARNFGVEKTEGEIVLFLDDDVTFDVDLLKNHALNYADSRVGGVAGGVISPGESVSHARKVGHFTPLGICRCNYNSDCRTWVHSPIGCNMSFRRELIFQAGLFDPDFIGSCHREESDFSFRLRSLGYGIVFDPRARVVHLVASKGGSRSEDPSDERSATFFRNETLFYLKHMPRKYWPVALPVHYRHWVFTKTNLLDGTVFRKTVNFFRGIRLGLRVYGSRKPFSQDRSSAGRRIENHS
jgi:glycosyltransferase involved in cell wall biosynthesis